MSDTVSAYDQQAGALAARYESVPADGVHAGLVDFIPRGRDLIALDVGAGSGRDAAWLASIGYQVIAAVMPAEGQRHRCASSIALVASCMAYEAIFCNSATKTLKF